MGNGSFTDRSGSGCLGEPMCILIASDLFHPFLLGGGETRMHEIARKLAKKHEIHVLTRKSARGYAHPQDLVLFQL